MARGTRSRWVWLGALVLQCCAWGRSPATESPASRVSELLRAGKASRAEQVAARALQRNPNDAAMLNALGDVRFQRADFAGAAEAYSAALLLDETSARAHWGLGRVNEAQSRRREAGSYFRQAFALDPNDEDIAQSYADSRRFDPRLASEYKPYLLPVEPVRSANALRGLLIEAVVEGSRPLHLLLDTGARGIVLNAEAVRDVDLKTIATSKIGGVGATSASARLAIAESVAFGPLRLAGALVEIAGVPVAAGIDGVVGFDTFAAFRIRVDAQARVLELQPFTGNAEDRDSERAATPFYGVRYRILVKAKINRDREGLFLVDTGAAFSSVARELVPAVDTSAAMLLSGPCGSQVYGHRMPAVEFAVAGQDLVDPAPVALDLRHISRQEGVEISGIIGFPTLANSRLTIDYRHGLFEVEKTR